MIYRKEIQGLRALAILLVVAAHAGVPGVQGGFIGVDVFFVISGHLITALLIQEHEKHGKIDLVGFFARRARRLLPALLTMILVVSLIAIVVMAPAQQLNQIWGAVTATLWSSNIYFALSSQDYFSAGHDSNLFLHTWSLGVEEQYYLLWPFLILLFFRAAKRADNFQLFKIILGLCIAFFAYSVFLTITKPLWGFYLMPSRIWQFGLGGISYVISIRLAPDWHQGGFARAVTWAGLLLIVIAAITLRPEMTYPGWWALLPSLGAFLILIIRRAPPLLANSVSEWLGNVSYSWYLWHWPILLLTANLVSPSPLTTATAVIISLLIAFVSYKTIENPIRRSARLQPRKKLTIFVALLSAALSVAMLLKWQGSAQVWDNAPSLAQQRIATSDIPIIYGHGCDEWIYSSRLKICSYGNPQASKTVVLLADSIGAQWFPALAHIYQSKDWKIEVITKSSCPIVDEPFFYGRIGRVFTECETWRNEALNWLAQHHTDVIFMGTTRVDYSEQQWIQGSKKVLQRLSPTTSHIYILTPTYALPFDAPSCMAKDLWQRQFFSPTQKCEAYVEGKHEDDIDHWLRIAASPFPNVSIINLNSRICPDHHCSGAKNGVLGYRDNQHLTASHILTYTEDLSSQIMQGLQPLNHDL